MPKKKPDRPPVEEVEPAWPRVVEQPPAEPEAGVSEPPRRILQRRYCAVSNCGRWAEQGSRWCPHHKEEP